MRRKHLVHDACVACGGRRRHGHGLVQTFQPVLREDLQTIFVRIESSYQLRHHSFQSLNSIFKFIQLIAVLLNIAFVPVVAAARRRSPVHYLPFLVFYVERSYLY
jgi:hypothetical protein